MKTYFIKKFNKLKKDMPDLIIKKIKCGTFYYVYIICLETVTSSDKVNDFILKYFSNKSLMSNKSNIKKGIEMYIPSINYKDINSYEDALNLVLNGFTIVIYRN